MRLSDRRFLAALAEAAGLPEAGRAGSSSCSTSSTSRLDGVRSELEGLGLPSSSIATALDTISALQARRPRSAMRWPTPSDLGAAAIEDLATTTACLNGPRPTSRWLAVDRPGPRMGYYTGQIFELSHPGSRSSVAGGGRYDQLIGRSLDRDVPACGFSIGFERIVDLLERAARRRAVALLVEADVPTLESSRPPGACAARASRSRPRRGGKFGAQLTRLEGRGLHRVRPPAPRRRHYPPQ